MFVDRLIPNSFLIKSEVCSVEVCFNENSVTYQYLILKKNGNKLSITEKGTSFENLILPARVLKSKIPVIVIINGKGVLFKKIEVSESEVDVESVVNAAFPAINIKDFYGQVFENGENERLVSISRKEVVDQVISDFRSKQINVTDLIIGVPAIIGLKPLWTNLNQLPTTNHIVYLINTNIDKIESNRENRRVKIDEFEIESPNTLCFAVGLSYLMQNRIAENAREGLDQFYKRHIESNKVTFIVACFVIVALVFSLTNAILYSSYFDKNNKLEAELGVYEGKNERINKLLQDYEKNKKLIEDAGILNKNKLSEFADKLSETLPADVVLTKMEFNPRSESMEVDDSLQTFKSKVLVIQGNCNKSLVINEWVNILKLQDFVKEVNLEKFTYNKEGLLPNFTIRIETN
jgi:Tfp pilus assembly protein PilN